MAEWTRRQLLVGSAAFAAATMTTVASMTTAGSAGTEDVDDIAQQVRRLYLAYFLREPEPGGWEFWINSGWALIHMSDFFAQSPEFIDRYGSLSNEEFVSLVYRNVLDREAEPGGYEFWTDTLNSGTTRGWMMVGFSESPEYKELTLPTADTPRPPNAPTTATTATTAAPAPDPGVSTP